MNEEASGARIVLAEARAPAGLVRLVDYHFVEPARGELRGAGRFRAELFLSSRHRTGRLCFRDLRSGHCAEPVGDLFVVHPEADLIARSDEVSAMTSVACELHLQPIMEAFGRAPEPADHLLMASPDVRDDRLKGLLLSMAKEARSPGFASNVLIDALCRQLSVEIFRQSPSAWVAPRAGGLAPWRLRRIEERLREAAPSPSLPELAELCGLSVRQLTRGFQESRGVSLGRHVAACEIDHAKRLLAAGESVAVIADKLGFASSSGFCAAFRRQTGVTPVAYRQLSA